MSRTRSSSRRRVTSGSLADRANARRCRRSQRAGRYGPARLVGPARGRIYRGCGAVHRPRPVGDDRHHPTVRSGRLDRSVELALPHACKGRRLSAGRSGRWWWRCSNSDRPALATSGRPRLARPHYTSRRPGAKRSQGVRPTREVVLPGRLRSPRLPTATRPGLGLDPAKDVCPAS